MNDDTFYTKLADMSDEEFAEEFMAQMDREGRVTHLPDEMSGEELKAAMDEWFYASMRNACRKGKFGPDGAA
jgi:hypothetical protein